MDFAVFRYNVPVVIDHYGGISEEVGVISFLRNTTRYKIKIVFNARFPEPIDYGAIN